MKILFFDIETTGLPSPETQKGSVSENFEQWPRIWQISALMVGPDNPASDPLLWANHYIKPPAEMGKEWIVDDGNPIAVRHEMVECYGIAPAESFPIISRAMHLADLIVCHNLAFDSRVFESECYRLQAAGQKIDLPPKKAEGKPKICTMNASTKHCGIPKSNGKGLKWPSLQELHEVLFKTKYKDAHDAGADVLATYACFNELVRLGVIDLEKAVNTEPKN